MQIQILIRMQILIRIQTKRAREAFLLKIDKNFKD